jgi:YD repeat-containing protein
VPTIGQDSSAGTTFYTWDDVNQLSICHPPAGVVTLSYDADGRRAEKQTPTGATRYLYDFQRVLRESDINRPRNRNPAPSAEMISDTKVSSNQLLVIARQAAAMCGKSERTWWSWNSAGWNPKPVRIGRSTLWRADELRQWVAAGCPCRAEWEAST